MQIALRSLRVHHGTSMLREGRHAIRHLGAGRNVPRRGQRPPHRGAHVNPAADRAAEPVTAVAPSVRHLPPTPRRECGWKLVWPPSKLGSPGTGAYQYVSGLGATDFSGHRQLEVVSSCLAQKRRTSLFAPPCRSIHYGPVAVGDSALGCTRTGCCRQSPASERSRRGSATPCPTPVISPHGDVDPSWWSTTGPSGPKGLSVSPVHYVPGSTRRPRRTDTGRCSVATSGFDGVLGEGRGYGDGVHAVV